MRFLARLTHTDSEISREAFEENRDLQTELEKFYHSYKLKQDVFEKLTRGEPIGLHLHTLQYALQEELADIEESEHDEKEIIHDLKYLSHEGYIRRLTQLEQEITQAEGQAEYVRKVLAELHDTIQCQARKVRRMLKTGQDMQAVLMDLLAIEKHLVEKLACTEECGHLFRTLAEGTRKRERILQIERRVKGKLKGIMRNIELHDGQIQSTGGHYLSQLTAKIFNSLEKAAMHAKEQSSDREYVDSQMFERFVRQTVERDRKRGRLVPSDRTLRLYVEEFRNLYREKRGVLA